MKEFIKKYSLAIVILAACVFLAVFLTFLFHKTGDDVYIAGINGNVSVGTTDDLNNLVMAQPGMKLAKNNIVVTGDKSSCILTYEKKASAKDNFVNIGENSQVMLYDKNSRGGYKFFITYGSLICNMTSGGSYETNISTKLFNLFTDGTITKVDYDAENTIGRVFTFDGNPMIQTIQPSGTTNVAEKLMKNSVCAVSSMDDGTVGFGSLNVGFELSSFTAQDLKTMSGIADIWTEKISYGSGEFERAFQTASDYAKWAVTDPAVITMPETETEAYISAESITGFDDEYYTETTTVTAGYETNSTLYTGIGSTEAFSSTAKTTMSVPFTAFTRQTVTNLDGEPSVTSVPVTESNTETGATRVSDKYETGTETTRQGYKDEITSNERDTETSTGKSLTENNQNMTTQPLYTTVPRVTTTVPTVIVNPNAYYTVIFAYNEGGKEYWSVQLVKYGQSAIAPKSPDVPGKRFIGWDKDYTRVTSDMTVIAVFADKGSSAAIDSEKYTVKFFSESKLWKVVVVNKGGTAVVSDTPVSSDPTLEFSGWSDNLSDIQSDKTVFALFYTK